MVNHECQSSQNGYLMISDCETCLDIWLLVNTGGYSYSSCSLMAKQAYLVGWYCGLYWVIPLYRLFVAYLRDGLDPLSRPNLSIRFGSHLRGQQISVPGHLEGETRRAQLRLDLGLECGMISAAKKYIKRCTSRNRRVMNKPLTSKNQFLLGRLVRYKQWSHHVMLGRWGRHHRPFD